MVFAMTIPYQALLIACFLVDADRRAIVPSNGHRQFIQGYPPLYQDFIQRLLHRRLAHHRQDVRQSVIRQVSIPQLNPQQPIEQDRPFADPLAYRHQPMVVLRQDATQPDCHHRAHTDALPQPMGLYLLIYG